MSLKKVKPAKRTDYVIVENVPVRAIAPGQYGGIVRGVDEEFLYTGKIFDSALPDWLEEQAEGALAKALPKKKAEKAEKKEEKPAKKDESKEEGNAADLMV